MILYSIKRFHGVLVGCNTPNHISNICRSSLNFEIVIKITCTSKPWPWHCCMHPSKMYPGCISQWMDRWESHLHDTDYMCMHQALHVSMSTHHQKLISLSDSQLYILGHLPIQQSSAHVSSQYRLLCIKLWKVIYQLLLGRLEKLVKATWMASCTLEYKCKKSCRFCFWTRKRHLTDMQVHMV